MATQKECDDPAEKRNIAYARNNELQTAEQCGDKCKGKSTMFAWGPKCLCEVSASEDGTCTEVDNQNYDLYRFNGTIKLSTH